MSLPSPYINGDIYTIYNPISYFSNSYLMLMGNMDGCNSYIGPLGREETYLFTSEVNNTITGINQ